MGVKEEHEYCCPSCGDDNRIFVTASTEIKLCSDGSTDHTGDMEWDRDSSFYCSACGHSAEGYSFRWDDEHPHWQHDDDDDEEEEEDLSDHHEECGKHDGFGCNCDELNERDAKAAAQPQGRIGLVHEHTLEDYRRAIEASGVLKSIDTKEENA